MPHTEIELQEYIEKRAPIDAEAKELARPLFAPGGFAHESPVPMIAFDRYGNVLWRNTLYSLWTGEGDESMEDHSLFEFLTRRDGLRVAGLLLEVFETKKPLTCVLRVRMMEGNYNHAEWLAMPIQNTAGEVIAIVSTGRDVAKQLRVERERTILYEIAGEINRQGRLHDVLRRVRDAIIEIGEFDRAGVWLVTEGDFVGSWGTDPNGNLLDERGLYLKDTSYTRMLRASLEAGNNHGIMLIDSYDDAHDQSILIDAPQPMAYIGLRVHDELVGMVFADNLLTLRNIDIAKVESILPLCEQCAIAIQNASLLEEREKDFAQRQHLFDVASDLALCSTTAQALELVLQTVLQIGDFTEGSAYRVVQDQLFAFGKPHATAQAHIEPTLSRCYLERARESAVSWLQEENGSQTLLLSLKHGADILAVLRLVATVGNGTLPERRLEYLREFVYQVGLIVHNVYLQELQQKYAERQLRLTALASAMTSFTDLDELLRMVHETLVTVAGFDRAGIWVTDAEGDRIVQYWGTNREGRHSKQEGEWIPLSQLSEGWS